MSKFTLLWKKTGKGGGGPGPKQPSPLRSCIYRPKEKVEPD